MRKSIVVRQRDIVNAELPENYKLAVASISECERIDQCSEWADRSAALASYAKQKKDERLLLAAKRIRVRAQTRIGDILLEYAAPWGGWGEKGKPRGIHPRRGDSPRYKAGLNAGLSRFEINRFVSMARVPTSKRERLIEQTPPVTTRELADLGRIRFFTTGRSCSDAYKELTASTGWGANLSSFCKWAAARSAAYVAGQLHVDEAARIRELITKAQDWLDELEQCMPKEAPREPTANSRA